MISSDQCIKYAEEKHYCPHCNERLSCCHAPEFHVGDGLGWGTEIFFVCLNDECSLFKNGWKHIEETYCHVGSYRYVLLPGAKKGDNMMVAGRSAFRGSIVDPEALRSQNKRFQQEKEALKLLDSCVEDKNLEPVLYLLTDEAAGQAGRERAVDLMLELNDLACIDPLRNHEFRLPDFENKVNLALDALLKANFKKECPYCAEIIKKQAKICQYCNREL